MVLSVEEVALLIQAAPGPKYRAASATAYGAGLRVASANGGNGAILLPST